MPAQLRAAVTATTSVVVVVALLVGCGSNKPEAGRAPGFVASSRPLDTAPFSPAGPSANNASTTLPGALFGENQGSSGNADEPGSATTTTRVPPRPVQVDPSTVTDLCGFEATVGSFENLPKETPERARVLVDGLIELASRYVEVAPVGLRQDLTAIRQELARDREVLAANGWDPKSNAYLGAVEAERNVADQPDSLSARLGRVAEEEHRVCR